MAGELIGSLLRYNHCWYFYYLLLFVDTNRKVTRLQYTQFVCWVFLQELHLFVWCFICSCGFYMTLMCPWRHTVDLRVMGAASLTSPRASGAVELSTETHNSKVPTSIHQYFDWSLQIKPQTCLDLSSSSSRSAVIQLMAAARAKRGLAFFTFGDDLLKRDLERIHHLLLKEATTVGECSGRNGGSRVARFHILVRWFEPRVVTDFCLIPFSCDSLRDIWV